jgi:predicted nucleic acid-binding protein
MRNTVVLIDSDVLIDYLTEREPFFEDARRLIEFRRKREYYAGITTQCLANIFYIIRKRFTNEACRELLLGLCYQFMIVPITGEMSVEALHNVVFTDFEDCLQSMCAAEIDAEYIITRNIRDFKHSDIKAITPSEFLDKFTSGAVTIL